MAKTEIDMNKLARLGAEARIEELDAELRALLRAFPGLRTPTSKAEAPTQAKARRTRKRNLSPETRKAASERMKKYWAEKRKAQKE